MMSKYKVAFLCFIVIFLISWRSNPPDGRTGAPTDSTCAASSCHSTNSSSIEGDIEISGLPQSLVAGMQYDVDVVLTVSGGDPTFGGFQMTSLIGNSAAGTFSSPGDNVGISTFDGRQYVDHRTAKSFTGSGLIYDVQWTAPSPLPSEDITFYAAGNFANGNGDRTGDQIRTTSLAFMGVQVVDNDNDGFDSDVDCDDNDPNINPDATEIINNNVDENCDGIAQIVDEDSDGFNSDEDCNDDDASINPAATEIVNNDIDEDCDGTAQADADSDGFSNDEDCNDNDASINPAAMEIVNNMVDEDCDGIAQRIDVDLDGFNSDEDCNDSDANINPGATEIVNNDVDEDCDGTAQMIDADSDGFNSDVDCNDSDANINPDATEIVNNDVDEDCDGTAQIIDADSDGFNSDEDCNDMNAAVNPDADEIPNDQIDNDCNGEIDDCVCTTEFDPVCGSDGNTYSNACQAMCAGITEFQAGECTVDEDSDGFNSDVDCDDTNADINPGEPEVVGNDIDENCDGIVEPGEMAGLSGKISFGDSPGLSNVSVKLSNGMETTTGQDGIFSFDSVFVDSSLVLTFSRNDSPLNGVSAIDVVQITNHILGKLIFSDDLRVLAADADGNGTISAIDLVHIINVIIGRWDQFLNRESWGFDPKEVRVVDILDINAFEIRAYKVGDVNGNANGN